MEEKNKKNNNSRDGAIGVGMIVGLLGLGYIAGKKHGKRIGALTAVTVTQKALIDTLVDKVKED